MEKEQGHMSSNGVLRNRLFHIRILNTICRVEGREKGERNLALPKGSNQSCHVLKYVFVFMCVCEDGQRM